MAIFPVDSVFPNTISPASYKKPANVSKNNEPDLSVKTAAGSDNASSNNSHPKELPSAGAQELTRQEQQQVRELAQRDREVRAHESAHKAAGGSLTGAVSFEYENGPDGRRYAVGGDVSIDTSEVPNDPEATILKAERIRSAALAPAQPSSQDLRVAAQASMMAAEARAELIKQNSTQNEPEAIDEDAVDSMTQPEKGAAIYQQTAQITGQTSSQRAINLLI